MLTHLKYHALMMLWPWNLSGSLSVLAAYQQAAQVAAYLKMVLVS